MDEEDPRIPCRYSSSCYQKNEIHHAKYKHPLNSDQNTNQQHEKEKETPESEDEAVLKKPKISASSFGGNLKQQKLNFFFKTKQTNHKSDDFPRLQNANKEDSAASESPCEVEETLENSSKDSENHAEDTGSISTNCLVDLAEARVIIKKLFLVDMPDDFFSFWKFCQQLNQENATNALKSIDFELVGPFDVLVGRLTEEKVTDLSSVLRHWRYYYDPPEFQTVLKSKGSDLFHVGYFRDEPDSLPVFVACNSAAKDAVITPIGENIFAALDWCIKKFEKNCSPFQKVKYSSLKTALHNWAKEHSFSLDTSTENIRTRNRNVVAKTLHHAGIIVPYDKKTELGYRPLAETQSNLIKLFKKLDETKSEERKAHLSKLHEVITWANIAMDEGDHGTCLELGLNLFSCGSHHVHRMALQQLTSAYDLLGRHSFSKIIRAHLEDRKKGDNLDVIK